MIKMYTKEEYAKSYAELLEILKYVPRGLLNKIPQNKIQYYIKNREATYEFVYDTSKTLENQKICKLTKILIANIYIDYWATDHERKVIEMNDKNELYKLEQKKRELYNPDEIFKEKKISNLVDPNKSIVIIKKKNLLKRLLNKIKQRLKK